MKHCPRCQQTYADDSLNFCLSDGSALAIAGDLSEPTVVLPPKPRPVEPWPRAKQSFSLYIALVVLALITGGLVVALTMTRSSPTNNDPPFPTQSPLANRAVNITNTVKPSANRPDEVVEYPDSPTEPLTADLVRNMLGVWERAQEAKSFSSYQACYDTSFVGIKKTKSGHSQSYTYSSWMADRRRMIASAVNLSLDLSNLQIRVQGDTAIVAFDQYYRSLRYSDWGPKEITVRITPSGPKIVREELKASYPL